MSNSFLHYDVWCLPLLMGMCDDSFVINLPWNKIGGGQRWGGWKQRMEIGNAF
jgi:hypothetical protein